MPLVGNDGTLYEADDDAAVGSTDPYSAVAFTSNGTSVTVSAGLFLPITAESERFGIALADDGTSYWGNNGQYFALTSPGSGFKLVATWPATGVTVATAPATASSSVTSDVAIDGRVNNYVFAYSAWETYDIVGNTSVTGVLVALRPADGSIAWTLSLPSTSVGTAASLTIADYGNAAPAIAADGTLYVGHGDGLRAVDGATGTVKWLFHTADVTSSPAIGGDGTIFFGVKDGTFYALNPAGTLRFKIATGGQVSGSPAIASDGTVYVLSDDGYLYAVK